MSEFATDADAHIADLIETLCDLASDRFMDANKRETLINQIAKLRASQNPTIVQNFQR